MSTPRRKNTRERISYTPSRTSIAISDDVRSESTSTAGPSLRDTSCRGLDEGAGDDDITNAGIVSNATTSRVNSDTSSFANFTPAFRQAAEAGTEDEHPRAPRWDDSSMEAGDEVKIDDEDAACNESYSSYRRGKERDYDALRANRRSGTSWSGGYRFYGVEEENKEFRGYGGGSVFRDEDDDCASRPYEHDMEKFDLADHLQRQAESRNVRHYHKTKVVHLPGGGSSGGNGDSGQTKSHESMKGWNSGGGGIEGGDRGRFEGGLREGKGSRRGRSEGGSGRCINSKEDKMRLKSKESKRRTKARDMGARKKTEGDLCLASLAGREKDEKEQSRKEIRRSRSTASMARPEKSPSNSDTVIAKNQMEWDFANGGKQGGKGFPHCRGGRGGGNDRVTGSRDTLLSPESDGRHSAREGWRRYPTGEDDLLQSRIKKMDNRPLDSHVKMARITLAKALRLGGRSVLLPGLCLRYHENITILLEDAALALEDGLFRQPQARKGSRSRSRESSKNNDWWTADLPSWVTAWAPELKVVDLSQNQLKGINPLLIVRVSGVPEGNAGAAVTSPYGENVSEKACTRHQPEPFVDAYPMRGIEELYLNGNLLHSIPPDMHLALPNLMKLELYGNLIEGIRMPEGQLPRLKHLNLGYNNLVELPSEISVVMPNLEELLLPNNCLERLPNEIAALKRLKRLDVSHNPLTSPPLEVAARGVDAVKRYFRDIEAQDRDTVKEREVSVQVPNQPKVIVVGHRDASKSSLIECLSSMPSGESGPPEAPRTTRLHLPPVEGSDRQTVQTTSVSNPRTNLENIQGSRPARPSANTPPLARRPHSTGVVYSGGVRQECSLPDTPEVLISTWEHTPTIQMRKRLLDVDDLGGHQTAVAAWKAALIGETEDRPCLSGASVEDVGNAKITLKLWDFGGTEEFHAVHGMFFSSRALYTVVFDLHHVEKDEIDKRVQFWVDCIQSRVPGAHILLVGTHADELEEAVAKERCHRVLEQIQDNEKCIVRGIKSAGDRGSQAARGLSHPKSRPQIETEVLAVSCDTQEKGFQAFREQVLRLAGDPKHFTASRLPPAWVEVDRLVKERRSQGYSITKVEELVGCLNSSSTNMTAMTDNDDNEEGCGSSPGHNMEDSRNIVVSTLNWLNDTSEVVFFDKPQLDEFVILHPLHLMEAIKLIVSGDLKKKLREIVQDSSYAVEERDHVETSVKTQTPTRKKGTGLVTTPPTTPTPAFSARNHGTLLTESAKRVSGQNELRSCVPRSAPSPQSQRSITTSPPAPSLLTAASGSPQVSTPLSGDFDNGGGNGGGRDDGRVGAANKCNKKPRDRRWRERRRISPQTTPAAAAGTAIATPVSADDPKRRRRRRGKRSVGHRAIGNDPPSSSTAAAATVAGTGTAEDQATPSPQNGNPLNSPEDCLSNNGIVTRTLSDTALSPAGATTGIRRNNATAIARSACKARRGALSSHDEVQLDGGFVSRAVVNALLEPLADTCWDTPARDFLIQLLQESCVLVKVAVETPKKGQGQSHQLIPRSLSCDNGMMARTSSYGSEQEGYSYFIPCILPTAQPDWRFNWVDKVHCGRRWRFHRFVPPSLMSALICRFYEMAKPGSARLCRGSILIKVPLGHGSTGRRPDAELFLILYRGRPSRSWFNGANGAKGPNGCSRLELWAQVKAGYHDAMMQRLQSFVEVIDKTLGEFPGLLVNGIVPCPACMERMKSSNPTHWGELPVEIVEKYRSCAGDLPSCNKNCRLQALQKRLMFVGERPHDIADTNAQLWDSPLPELGSGLRVPRVNSLYPAICPIAVYDCEEQCFTCQATAFVVDAEKGLLLTAAHTFLKPNKVPNGTRLYWNDCRKENCVVLVAMLQPPYQYDTRWEFVADAVQHSRFVRRAVYDDIGWKLDHPVLLRIKRRFHPVPIRDDAPRTFRNITTKWRRPPDRDTQSRNPDAHPESGLTELILGESRMLCRPLDETDQTDRLILQRPEALLEMLRRPEAMNDVCMSMTVFPQELLTLIGWPNHLYPNYSSICVTHGPVARNIVAQDVMEVLLSNNVGASGGPLVDTRGEVVGILSQANLTSAYVMGITTAKTILEAKAWDLEEVYNLRPLDRLLDRQGEL